MIPIIFFLIPYGIILALFVFFALVDMAHLIGFGRATGIVGFLATFLFLAGTVLLAHASYQYLIVIDWSHLIQIIPSFAPPSFH